MVSVFHAIDTELDLDFSVYAFRGSSGVRK